MVDERIDYELLVALADGARGSVVMVGPWTKVNRATFPQRENLHWLGGRDYSELPNYAKAFDVCMMPFALNKATEFINPTKALEYMATGRPIVSTAVEDVVLQFSEVVDIAATAADFIHRCARRVARQDRQAIERGLRLVARNSWESIVTELERHVDDALSRKRCLETNVA